MGKLLNLQEFTISTAMAASTPGAEETITLGSGEGADFPSFPGWQGVIFRQDRLRPDRDVNHEFVSVVSMNVGADQLTVLRGQEGTSASAHNQVGVTYVLWLVASARYLEVREEAFYPEDFGAAADGVTDDTIPIQRAVNAAAEHGPPLRFASKEYVVAGTVKIDDTTTFTARHGFHMEVVGTGRFGTKIIDKNTDAECWSFKKPTAKSVFSMVMRGMTFVLGVDKIHSTSGARVDSTYFERISDRSRFVDCFWGSREDHDNSTEYKARSLFRTRDSFLFDMENCYWWGKKPSILCHIGRDTDNLDGITFSRVQASGGESNTNFYFEGGGNINRIRGLEFKTFGASMNIGRVEIATPSDWTAGSTQIEIGAGHTLVEGSTLFLSSAAGTELVIVKTYPVSTTKADLYEGLKFNHSAGPAEIFGPHCGVAASGVFNLRLEGHFEGAYLVAGDCRIVNTNDSTFGSDMQDATDTGKESFLSGAGNNRPINICGPTRRMVSCKRCQFISPAAATTKRILTSNLAGGTTTTVVTGQNTSGNGANAMDDIVDRTVEAGPWVRGDISEPQSWYPRNHASAASLGTVTDRLEVYDREGTLIGYAPVYDTIT